jgi:pyruvate/2-oxoglutarate dehydrogenase complex dihydrolipoamide acyltransferase (E2) component
MAVAITVGVGDEVAEGDVVAIVESMKLETALRSPAAGRVVEVLADVNTQVETGAKLVRIEQDPALDAGGRESEARVDLSTLAGAAGDEHDPAAAAADALAALRSMVLGYDIDGDEARRQLDRLAAARAELPAGDPRQLAGEAEILRIFGDISALWRNRRVPRETEADDEAAVDAEATHNQQEYLHAYLRSRDADLEGLPE